MNIYPRLQFDAQRFSEAFDREPVPFTHNLGDLDLFQMSALYGLAEKFTGSPRDYMVAGGAPKPDTEFFSVPGVADKPHEVLAKLDSGSYRILLKRAENYDRRYKELVETLFERVIALRGGLQGAKVVRLESGILISSAA
ncbi:MAG: hypothetical protein WA324_18030, partial [Bryobacteraceae bacterium]